MRDSVSVRGHTSVILVLDLRQFVVSEHQNSFESIRGSQLLAGVLHGPWKNMLHGNHRFRALDEPPVDHTEPRTSTEEIGFISGIFRRNMLDEYATPTYALDKDQMHFSDDLKENLQFKELFWDVWRRWDIFVRPTMTGMFVVRMTRHYDKATPIMTVASDVIRLQMVFDLPGALQRQRELADEPPDGNTAARLRSMEAFLQWMAHSEQADDRADYVPVQWKLAVEVCQQFVQDVGATIPLPETPLTLAPLRSLATPPLYDSYVIYHIEELTALDFVVQKARVEAAMHGPDDDGLVTTNGAVATATAERHQVLVTPEDIRNSNEIQRNLVHLIEGSILERTRRQPSTNGQRASAASRRTNRYFPTHRPDYIADILQQDRATWNDEVCLLAPRAAIIIPSRRAGQDALFISNFSATTGRVMYSWYWDAMERMVEFVIEIRVLAHLLERSSADVLQQFVQALRQIRSGMLRQDNRLDYQSLTPLIDQVANLSRIAGMCQGLSNPSVWSRAEYAVDKARHLLDQQDVPLLLEHTERNVNNLTSLLDHADELYLAELSERSNQETFWLSLVLAGLSLSITLFALPSFYADIEQLNSGSTPETIRHSVVPWIGHFGSVLAPMLIMGSFIIAAVATVRFVLYRTRSHRLARTRRLRELPRKSR